MQSRSWWGLGMCNLTIYIPERHLWGRVWWDGKMGWKVFFKPQRKVAGMFIWENKFRVMVTSLGRQKLVWARLLSSVMATEIKVSAWLGLVCPRGCLQKRERAQCLLALGDRVTQPWCRGVKFGANLDGLTDKRTVGPRAASSSSLSTPCSLPPPPGESTSMLSAPGLLLFLLKLGHGGLSESSSRDFGILQHSRDF